MRLVGPPIPPLLEGVPLSSLSLEQRATGPRWVVKLADGTTRIADPQTGLLLPQLSAADAAGEVAARYNGSMAVRSVMRTSAEDPPLDLRRPVAAWQVTMEDGTRFYDLMWGFHIMDLKTREDTHNPLVIGFGLIAFAVSAIGVILLPKTLKRKGRETA
jgi:hypothetical protein